MSGLKNGPIFAVSTVCEPKFTKFGRRVWEWPHFATLFSSQRCRVPVWRNLQWSRKMA